MFKKISFPRGSYDHDGRQSIGIEFHALPEASIPPLSPDKVCLPREADGEHRPYREHAELIVSPVNGDFHTLKTLGATVCPRFFKCSECPLR